MKPILVYGSLEFGRIVKDLVQQCGHQFAGFIDDYGAGGEILGAYEQVKEKYPPDAYLMAIAVGYNNLKARWAVYRRTVGDGYALPPLIHPRAYVRDEANISQGAIIMAGAIVDVNAHIGEAAVLWPGVVVNHDSRIGPNSFISPNVTICGYSTLGMHCFAGAGSVIVDHVTVPDGAFIKANSVFTHNSRPGLYRETP